MGPARPAIFARFGDTFIVRTGTFSPSSQTSVAKKGVHTELDSMLETARRKFLDPSEDVRREALQALWDGWERLKTLGCGRNKSVQAGSLLDSAAASSSSQFRSALEREAGELNWIGNNLQIRHSERNQERITRGEHVDYLFHRLFGLVQIILRMEGSI